MPEEPDYIPRPKPNPRPRVSPIIPKISRDPDNVAGNLNFQSLFEAFSCDVPKGSPSTPDELAPDIFFNRRVFNDLDITMPDGEDVRFWGFFDDIAGDPKAYPSKMIRLTQGQIMHCFMKPTMGTHTIHWHGIEPTAMNDGVGKLSFEVNSGYTYQWQASEAGTYFYHCHHNTVLHFEMGMVGPLIIDPPDDPGDPPGTKRAFAGGPAYDVEAIWMFDDVDPVWRQNEHDAGLNCPFGDDAGLNRFDPKYFMITGVPYPWTRNLPSDPVHPGVAVTVQAGQTLLIRLICAAYTVNRYTLNGLDAEMIAVDGRPLGQAPYSSYSQPLTIASGVPFDLTAARRFDLIVRPTADDIGQHRFVGQFKHFVSGITLGIADTYINVTA